MFQEQGREIVNPHLGPAAWKPLADYLSTFFLQVEINIPETSLRKEIFKGLLFRSPL